MSPLLYAAQPDAELLHSEDTLPSPEHWGHRGVLSDLVTSCFDSWCEGQRSRHSSHRENLANEEGQPRPWQQIQGQEEEHHPKLLVPCSMKEEVEALKGLLHTPLPLRGRPSGLFQP